jgi:hypothetical protein
MNLSGEPIASTFRVADLNPYDSSTLNMVAAGSSEILVFIYGVTHDNTIILIFTAVRASNVIIDMHLKNISERSYNHEFCAR